MKLGKRGQETEVPGVPGVKISSAAAKRAKRSAASAGAHAAQPAPAVGETVPADEPSPAPLPLGYAEPVVDGDAVELPPVEPAAPIYEPPAPPTMQGARPEPMAVPAAEQPVSAVEAAGSVGGGTPVTPLADSGEAFASGHAAGPAPGPAWQEPLMELANERPEVVVGAAFAGGLLAAMILRRLGS